MFHVILEPLTEHQQRLVDVAGNVYHEAPGEWPIFEHVEWMLEKERLDAREVIDSFPRIGDYSAVDCPYTGTPHPETPVALTIVGVHHCKTLRNFRPRINVPQTALEEVFFDLLRLLVEQWRRTPRSPSSRTPVTMTDEEARRALSAKYPCDMLPPAMLLDMLTHEPVMRGQAPRQEDDTWSVVIPRAILDFENVNDIADYVARVQEHQPSAPMPAPAAPSPLGLVAALDYLDTVWQLAHGRGNHLFRLDGFERAAKLSHPANASDEFSARISALAEILRSTRDAGLDTSKKDSRERPLRRLEVHLTKRVGSAGEARIAQSVRTLEDILSVRDAGQHGAAGQRAAKALIDLGIGYPISGWPEAWEMVQSRTIEAVDAIREELATAVSEESTS